MNCNCVTSTVIVCSISSHCVIFMWTLTVFVMLTFSMSTVTVYVMLTATVFVMSSVNLYVKSAVIVFFDVNLYVTLTFYYMNCN